MKAQSTSTAASPALVSGLTPNPRNPRKVSDKKVLQLSKSMAEHGDLSGIVFNRKTGHLAGGHQRAKNFDATARVVYRVRYKKPTPQGTVAEGYIVFRGEKFTYREVSWSLKKEQAAMLAANKNAGEWDTEALEGMLRELSSFDADVDLDTTMFDTDELVGILGTAREDDGGDDQEDQERAPSKLVHDCPRCGYSFR